MPFQSFRPDPVPVSPLRRLALAALAACQLVALPALAVETLSQAWEAAMAADRRLKSAELAAEAADFGVASARGAHWPSVSLSAGYTRLDEPPATRVDLPPLLSATMPLGQESFHTRRLEVTLPLFTSGRIAYGVAAAEANSRAARSDSSRVAQDLRLDVAEHYVNILRARRGRELALRHVDSLQSHTADAANLQSQGLVARNDLLAAQVALADARQRLIRADNALALASAAYNRQLGRRLAEPVEIAELSAEAEPAAADFDALVERALGQRPELEAIAAQAEALDNQAKSVRGQALPQVALIGARRYEENRYMVHDNVTSVTLGVQWSLFDGGVVRGQARALESRAESARAILDDARSQVALEIRKAWLDRDEAVQRLAVTAAALEQADENLRVARDRYRNGVGTQTEVLDAETQRTGAESNHVGAVYDRALAGLRLRRAAGEL